MSKESDKTRLDESYYHNEGIINKNEPFETVFLDEDEIEKFMKQYMAENPGVEVETRYVNQEPIDMPQNIEVRWLRPITPEIPPIIIQEVNVVEKEQTPIRIIQKAQNQLPPEPLIIREKPEVINIPEPKTIYLPTILKKRTESDQNIKIDHVRSDSQSNYNSRLVYDEQVFSGKKQQQDFEYSYSGEQEEEEEIQMYEERLMQTLYEEYLLKLERERLERKLRASGVFEDRIRERELERVRSVSRERSASMSQRISNRYGQTRSSNRLAGSQTQIPMEKQMQEDEIRLQRIRDDEFRLQQQRLRDEVLRLTQQEKENMERERDLQLARDEARKIRNEYTQNLMANKGEKSLSQEEKIKVETVKENRQTVEPSSPTALKSPTYEKSVSFKSKRESYYYDPNQ